MALLIAANFFCEHCHKERMFLPIHFAALLADVTRQTIYRWMNRDWLHCRPIPSGRRLICLQSLLQVHTVDRLLLESLVRNLAPDQAGVLPKLV
jgi:hypothetical protein